MLGGGVGRMCVQGLRQPMICELVSKHIEHMMIKIPAMACSTIYEARTVCKVCACSLDVIGDDPYVVSSL